jgi:hypothetical protein
MRSLTISLIVVLAVTVAADARPAVSARKHKPPPPPPPPTSYLLDSRGGYLLDLSGGRLIAR